MELTDENFKFYENGRKFSKWVENTMEKGEIACSEKFLLFYRVFKRLIQQTGIKTMKCLGKR